MTVRGSEQRARLAAFIQSPRLARTIGAVGIVTVVGLFGITFWALVVHLSGVDQRLFPGPLAVGTAMMDLLISERFWSNFLVTTQEAVTGLSVGCLAAILVGIVVANSRAVEIVFMPYAVALQSMPKMALAPLIVVWFGFGFSSKVILVATLVFFPMLVNVIAGLRSSPSEEVQMLRASGASRLQLLYFLQFPNALSFIFAALEACVVLGVIGAIIGEYVGAEGGIGYQMLQYYKQFRTAEFFALMIVLAALGFGQYLLVGAVRRRVVFWSR